MADTDVAPDFARLSLAAKLQDLRFEGRNVIIRLGDGTHDTLVLHHQVLIKASERFAVRLQSSHWEPTRKVKDPKTGDVVKVFEYRLAQIEDTFCLTDEKESVEADDETMLVDNGLGVLERFTPQFRTFHVSRLADGYGHMPHGTLLGNKDIRAQSAYQHKLLFTMLYRVNALDIDLGTAEETVVTLTNLTALAEYYMLLPKVGRRIAARLEATPGIWEKVARNSRAYLVLATKLRSSSLFTEAIIHVVGIAGRSEDGHLRMYIPEVCQRTRRIADDKLENLCSRKQGLTRQLRSIGLYFYQAHPEAETKRKRGPLVRTTWLAADNRKKTFEDKCEWIAASIYREKLDQLMYGEEHWSHVDYGRNGKKNGDVQAGSLFIAAKALMAAYNSPQNLDIFGHNAAKKFACIFDLHQNARENPTALINRELRRLVRSAVHAIQYWLPLPDAPANEYASGVAAEYRDVDYFTHFGPGYTSVPWDDDEEYGEEDSDERSEDDENAEADGKGEDGGVQEARQAPKAVVASKEWLELIGA